MRRLLIPAGDPVALLRRGRTPLLYFCLTAYDPAAGLYLGMGHKSGTRVVGYQPADCVCAIPGEATKRDLEVLGLVAHPRPGLGRLERQGALGVAGRLTAPARGQRVETAKARPGPAVIRVRAYLQPTADELPAWPAPRDVPITITDTARDKCFGFISDTAVHRGMSGAPILQDGRLVGAVWGSADPGHGLGTDIRRMTDELLRSAPRRGRR